MARIPLLTTLCVVSLLVFSVSGAILEWDADGTLPVGGGTGNWEGGATWYDGSGYQVWSNNNDAVFGGTAGTVSISTGVTPSSLTFNTAGYTVQNGTLTLGGPSVVANADATIAATLAGSSGMNKTGTGMLSLTGMANHTGGTTVSAGTLRLARSGLPFPSTGSTGQFGSAHTVIVQSGATLQLNASWVTGDGLANQIVVNGGTLQFLNSDNYQGNIVLTGGTITTSGGYQPWRTGNWGSGLITVNASSTPSTISGALCFVGTASAPTTTFNVADGPAADDLILASNIVDHPGFEGRMKLVKTGLGKMVMSGSSTYSGGTTISQGTIEFSSAAAFGSGTITLGDAGTGANPVALLATTNLTLNNNIVVSSQGTGTATIGTTTFNPGGVPTIFNGTLTLNRPTILTGGNADRTAYQGAISGNVGTLTITGGARTTLHGNNTFVGDVVITGSGTILQVEADNNIPDTSSVDVGAGTIFQLVWGDQTIAGLTGSGTVRPYPTLGSRTLTVSHGNFSGLLTDDPGNDGSRLSLTKTGPGTLVLSNPNNDYDGVVQINGGVLSISSLAGGNGNCALGAMYGIASNLIFNGGTLQYTGSTVSGINRAFTINAGGATLDIANAATSVQWTDASGAGPIIGVGSLTKTGPGTLILASPNTYAGNTTVSQGTLRIQNNNSVGTTGTVYLGDAGTGSANVAFLLDGTISGWNFSRPIVVTNSGTGTATIGSSAGGASAVVFSSPITLQRNVILQGQSTSGTTFAGQISGTGNITIDSAGTSNGRVTLDNNANDFVGNVTVNSNAVLQLNGTSVIPDASNVTVNGILYFNSAGETINALAGTGTIQVHPSVNWDAVLTVGAAGGSGTFSGVIQNGGAGASTLSLVKTGAGTQTLNSNASNAMTGSVTVNGGTLRLAGNRGFNEGYFQSRPTVYTISAGGTLEIGSAWNTSSIASYVVDGGTLRAASGTDANYVNNLTMTGGQVTAASGSGFRTGYFFNSLWTINASATGSVISSPVGLVYQSGVGTQLTLDVADGPAAVDLLVSGPVYDVLPYAGARLVKAGPGVASLTGSNTYIGGTTVNAGTLAVNNTSGSGVGTGDVVVNADGTLAGSGIIGLPADAANVTVNVGGHLAPGNSPGILTIYGNTTLAAGSFFDVELAGPNPGTGYDQLMVYGNVSLGGANLNLVLLFAPSLGGQFVLINNDGTDPIVGAFAGLPEGSAIRTSFEGSEYSFTITYQGLTGNDVVLTAVPEPGTAILAAMGLGLLLGLGRFRRRES